MDRKTDYHNRGQEDAANGRGYNPPVGLLEDALTWSSNGMRQNAEDNGAYKSGYSKGLDDKK